MRVSNKMINLNHKTILKKILVIIALCLYVACGGSSVDLEDSSSSSVGGLDASGKAPKNPISVVNRNISEVLPEGGGFEI